MDELKSQRYHHSYELLRGSENNLQEVLFDLSAIMAPFREDVSVIRKLVDSLMGKIAKEVLEDK